MLWMNIKRNYIIFIRNFNLMQKSKKKVQTQVRQEYLVQVTMIEARNLKGKDGTGSCDPFIKITVSGQAPQVTTTKKQASSCVFNQSFTFTNIWLNGIEFESFEIKIEVIDLQEFGRNRLIGEYSIGLSTLFRNPQHEIYNSWLRLTHPEEGLEPQGYVLCSAYIISSEDRPPVHDINENQVEEEPDEFGGKPDDQLTGEELQRRRAKKQMIAIVQRPEMIGKSYQLMVNIYKAEELPIMSFGKCDSFISVRCGGITLVTAVMKNMQKPQYATRFMFPLYFPVLNDKIVIRVWDKRVCMADTYIGMIPEVPQENDFFNVNFLQSRGGVMPYRWFSLYGVPLDERPSNFDEMFLGYKKKLIGTDYMGRVCLSLNLTPSEKPDKMVKPLNTFKEPEIQMYLCRVDFYEIQDAHECGEFVVIKVSVGSLQIYSEKANIKKDKNNPSAISLNYTWKEKQISSAPEQKLELPADAQQVPDLFISLYDEWNKRRAYLRIPYISKDLETSKPKWYTLICVRTRNTSEGKEDVAHSFLLCNIMLRPEGQVSAVPRIPVKRNVKATYNFHCWIYAGYDMCPDCYTEEVEVSFEININDFKPTIKLGMVIGGKNPIWNKRFVSRGQLDENLEFSNNIIIKFINMKKKEGWFESNLVGEVCIQPFKCIIPPGEKEFKIEDFTPEYQFYQVMNKEGCSVGRILAAFHLERLKKNQKASQDPTNGDLFRDNEFKPMTLQFPVFGVRRLPTRLKQAIINVRVPIPPNFASETQAQNVDGIPDEVYNKYYSSFRKLAVGAQKQEDTTSWFSVGVQDPNFLTLINLPIYIPDDLRFWPQVEIELRDMTNPKERYISVIPLITLAKKADPLRLSEAIRFFRDAMEPQAESEDNKNFAVEEEEVVQNQKSNNDVDSLIRQKLQMKQVVNVLVDNRIEISVTREDVELLKENSKVRINRLKGLLSTAKDAIGFDLLKGLVKREIEKSMNYEVRDDQFFGASKDDDEEGGQFDYGRKTLKGPYEDEIRKCVPFKRYELFHLSSSKYGIIGNTTNAFIKGDMKIIPRIHAPSIKSTGRSTKRSQRSQKVVIDTEIKSTFNLFSQDFLSYFENAISVKVRVYILRCLNLAAQTQHIDTKHMLAGLNAFCEANPFPEITVGDGGGKSTELIKHVYQSDSPMKNTLSPEFFRMYELDASLPYDWKMVISIRDKGIVDGLIGSVEIDLEDRMVGEPTLKERIGYVVARERCKVDLLALKFEYDADSEKKKQSMAAKINNFTQLIDTFDKDRYQIPVEYCELKKLGQNQTSQGTIEMFVEVLPLDIAREISPSVLSKPLPLEYEVRLIILETLNIPLITKKGNIVDIFVRASMDSSATGTDAVISKETDTHLGSKDGDGQFNWRMKFPFIWPCPFPRLILSVYDMNAFTSDECMGEATVSLKRITGRLSTDGSYEMPPTKVKLSHPNFIDADRGEVFIQLKIVTKQSAEASPVGDAQDEPNEDPFLSKPTTGRGLADFFAGGEGGRGFMFYLKVGGGIIGTLLIIMVLFVKPGILVN